MAEAQRGRASRTLEVPAVLVGVGRFGVGVAERLTRERAQALALDGRAIEDDASLAMVVDPLESEAPDRDVPEVFADRVLERVRSALAHARMVAVRDATAIEHQTRLTILVFADLGEAPVREHLGAILARIQGRLLAELGPIFEAFRVGRARNGVILPLVTMPHPPSHADGPAIADCVRALLAQIVETPPRRRALPQLYLIEDVAEFSVLSRDELAQCVRNFATLLLYADLSAGDVGSALGDHLLHGSQPDEPLATFVCAVAELPRAKLAAYGRDRVALELLDAIGEAPRIEATFSEADALELIEVEALERDGQADEAQRDVRAVLERYAPPVDPDPPPRWYERGEVTSARYGPDPGDPSVIERQPPAVVPTGWLQLRMREIESTWRLLQRKRFDDVVAKDRASVERWRDDLLAKLRKRVDRELWADPSPASLRRTEELVAKLRRAFAEQLDDAVRERDRTQPAPPPDFEELRQAHARMLDAARRKPDPPRMLLWAVLAVFAAIAFVAPVLAMFADAVAMDPGRWYTPLFRKYGWLTATVLGLLGVGGWFGWVLGKAHLALLDALTNMWTALRDTIVGGRGSLLEYFTTRLRLSRAIARVESLLAVCAALDADAETLLLIDKAARRARGELRDNMRELGVVVASGSEPGERDDLSGLLGRNGETLVEAFVGEAGAREIVESLVPEGRESRLHDVLGKLAAYYGRGDRWREELPFADLERLRRASSRYAEPIARWDPFAGAARAEDTSRRLAEFVRRQRRSLRGALNFTGYEDLDATGVTRPFQTDGEAIVPKSAIQMVEDQAGAGSDHMAMRPGIEPDRAYYVVTASGIAEASVASLKPVPRPFSSVVRGAEV